MLFRSIMQEFQSWKERDHHPLLVRGLRQIGKTYAVKRFAEENYKYVVYIDLRAQHNLYSAFSGDFNVDMMVMSITAAIPDAIFRSGETILILDEIQDCPNARSSLKYWDMDGRYDVMATGSFLGVKGFRQVYKRGIPVGYEEQITMHPLTFLEFLVNLGVSMDVISYLKKSIKEKTPIQQSIHETIMRYYLQYLIVGGMPEAVKIFLETHDLNEVRRVQTQIIDSIRDDFGRYVDADGNDKINEVLKLRAEACLLSIPAQLSKEYKKFQYSLVNAKGHSPEKADGLKYLEDVGLVCRAYNVREISSPLEAQKKDNEFKVYMVDTGLLISMLEQGLASLILKGDISSYKGAVAENMLAAAFVSSDMPLYYYHAPSGSPELDFIYSDKGEPVIVECKSTNNRATSMKYVLSHPNKYGKHRAVKIAAANVGDTGEYLTLPLYAVGLLPEQDREQVIEVEDVNKLNAML